MSICCARQKRISIKSFVAQNTFELKKKKKANQLMWVFVMFHELMCYYFAILWTRKIVLIGFAQEWNKHIFE